MGPLPPDTMQTGCSLAALLLAILALGCLNVEGRSFDADMVKRGLRDPNDPRNLFNTVYGINYKRAPEPAREEADLASLYGLYMDQAYAKRGLRDPNDPRNLFRAIYGYRK